VRSSPEERAARGRAARAKVARRSHATWDAWPGRPDPLALLERQDAARAAELVPIRYGRMLDSPLAFYRGAASVMASDLQQTPASGITVQSCGDAHLLNFGVFGTPERRLVFDIDDFDETHPGPWEWDVKRLAASLAVAGRTIGMAGKTRTTAVRSIVREYRTAMRGFAAMGELEVWYAELDADRLVRAVRDSVGARATSRAEAGLERARTHDSLRAVGKLTKLVDGKPRFDSLPPLLVPIDELEGGEPHAERLRLVVDVYRRSLPPERRRLLGRFEVVDLARKVVGVGSVGTDTWVLLLLGKDEHDPLVLQAKEAGPSVLEQYVRKTGLQNSGERVVIGQRLMQAASDIFLGWSRITALEDAPPRDYYVRQLHDWKGAADVTTMRADELAAYARLCAWTLARAHARTGDRIAIAGYLGGGTAFDDAIASFAEAYADQNERDFAALADAAAAERVDARNGV
jgi:uncharacterized protein (DUF2252 family)